MPIPDFDPQRISRQYTSSTEFPDEARVEIPESLLNAIDDGNRGFFASLASDFPRTYACLVESCPPVRLLEVRVPRDPSDPDSPSWSLFAWGFVQHDRLIRADIPAFDPILDADLGLDAEHLGAIPAAFRAFYERFDGMTIAEGLGQRGYDFPAALGLWTNVVDHFASEGWSVADAMECASAVDGGDPRVVLRTRSRDFVLAAFEGGRRSLYLASADAPTRPVLLEDSVAALDGYFAWALQDDSRDGKYPGWA